MAYKEDFLAWYRRNFFSIAIFFFLVLFFVVLFWHRMFFTVPSGHAGVLFRRFLGGTVTDTVRSEGFQVIPPWDTLTIYDVRVQQIEHSFSVISSNGLTVHVSCSIRYQPKVELLGMLHKEIGPDYVNKIILPEVQSLIRETFGHFTPEEMYTTKRTLVEQALQSALRNMSEEYVALNDLLLKTLILPPQLQAAIEAKLVEEQHVAAMRFRIERETLESERKIIEAVGVQLSQKLIAETISDQLLSYKGIEATLKLAESPNAKVVVIGGKNGLPVILDSGFNQLPMPPVALDRQLTNQPGILPTAYLTNSEPAARPDAVSKPGKPASISSN